ncbi:MAG: alpha/beta hydrolase [Bacteriovoracales bacterium]|nr:alpha/beta hydrolase [Bacteriovoracales bacterium]
MRSQSLRLFISLLFCTSCSQYFYHPSKEIFPLPLGTEWPSYRDILFKAKDGVRLHGRLFLSRRKKAKGIILQFHGNAQNLTAHSLALTWVVRHGFHLLAFDYRGYGRSQSFPNPEGIRLDGLAFLQKAREIHLDLAPQGKFIVIGQSLGGAVALRAVQDFAEKDEIDLVVLDSAFASYQGIAFKKLSSHWMTWVISPLAYILVSDKTAADLNRFHHPILVIHSENDPVVPFECSQEIYRQVMSTNKTFWRNKEVGHILAFSSRDRQKRLMKFFSEALGENSKK